MHSKNPILAKCVSLKELIEEDKRLFVGLNHLSLQLNL